MDVVNMGLQSIQSLNQSIHSRDYLQRLEFVIAAVVVCSAYLHLVVRRATPSYSSLLALVPLLVLNTWLPTVFPSRAELITRVVFGLLLFWLANFKAIGLCLNRGPLASGKWNLFQFSLLYLMPIYPCQDGPTKKGRLADSAGSTSKVMMLTGAHAVLLSLLAYLLKEVPLPVMAKHYIYALALCSFVSFIMNGPAALLIGLAELDVVPPFDKPWMSNSLADFWGRRWNNTVSLTLRSLIYDPIVEGCLIHKPAATTTKPAATPAAPAAGEAAKHNDVSSSSSNSSRVAQQQQQHPRVSPLRRLAGMSAVFAISGIMHEFLLMYSLHERNQYPAGFWFMFFFIQAPLLALEDMAQKRLRKSHTQLPRPLGIGTTTLLLMFTAYFFWYPPVETYTDVAMRVVEAVNTGAASAVHSLQQVGRQLGLHEVAQAATTMFSTVTHAPGA